MESNFSDSNWELQLVFTPSIVWQGWVRVHDSDDLRPAVAALGMFGWKMHHRKYLQKMGP
jgi:hypothetical protein